MTIGGKLVLPAPFPNLPRPAPLCPCPCYHYWKSGAAKVPEGDPAEGAFAFPACVSPACRVTLTGARRGLSTENLLSKEFLVVWSFASLLLLALRFCKEKSTFSHGTSKGALMRQKVSRSGNFSRNFTLLSCKEPPDDMPWG